MNTGELLLRAVLCDPGDDTARLVFADYQEEHGGEGWAYLIRQWGQPTVCPAGMSADVCFYPGPAAGTHYTVKLAEGRVGVQYVVRRGFVDEIRCPAAAFTEGFARELFSRHPVTRVVLTDAEPLPDYDGSEATWLREWQPGPRMSWEVPPQLWRDDLGDWFPTADEANAALSAVCVAWGRSLADLPPLPHASGGA